MCTEAKDSLIPKSQRQTAALYTICMSMNETKEFQKGFAPLTCKIMRMNGFVEQIWVDIGGCLKVLIQVVLAFLSLLMRQNATFNRRPALEGDWDA